MLPLPCRVNDRVANFPLKSKNVSLLYLQRYLHAWKCVEQIVTGFLIWEI